MPLAELLGGLQVDRLVARSPKWLGPVRVEWLGAVGVEWLGAVRIERLGDVRSSVRRPVASGAQRWRRVIVHLDPTLLWSLLLALLPAELRILLENRTVVLVHGLDLCPARRQRALPGRHGGQPKLVRVAL
jgi:hypothetical protein